METIGTGDQEAEEASPPNVFCAFLPTSQIPLVWSLQYGLPNSAAIRVWQGCCIECFPVPELGLEAERLPVPSSLWPFRCWHPGKAHLLHLGPKFMTLTDVPWRCGPGTGIS